MSRRIDDSKPPSWNPKWQEEEREEIARVKIASNHETVIHLAGATGVTTDGFETGDIERANLRPDWAGASNVAPKKLKKPQPQPWLCPNCQTTIERHFAQCPTCLAPRTNSYGSA